MDRENLEVSLRRLRGMSVQRVDAQDVSETAGAVVQLRFSDGSRLSSQYWRVVRDQRAGTSSFDHQQRYGLPAPINAIECLAEQLLHRVVTEARLDRRTGDLVLLFDDLELQVFNFTGYEVWEVTFPDGTGEYSPYAK